MDADDAALRKLAGEVAARLLERGATLVTAESCTGGWIGKVCTDLAGSSRWFRGGAIVYDNELKTDLTRVDPHTLARHGAVSEAVVREMAAGAMADLGGDIAVAVSGIAGPDGGSPEKPVGTVWFAWAVRTATRVDVAARLCVLPGDREAVRRRSVVIALEGVLERCPVRD
jgi:nicotinamide-nucleotide amidase